MSEHFLMFAAPINPQTQATMIAYTSDLVQAGATKLTIALSSPGGAIVNGVTIYNALMAMPYEIVTHNIGNVDSIATAVFLAGRKRASNQTATFMFHGVGFDSNPHERLEEKNLLEKLDVIESEHERISNLIASKTSLSATDCRGLFKQQTTRDAAWALGCGLATEIGEFRLPTGARLKYLV